MVLGRIASVTSQVGAGVEKVEGPQKHLTQAMRQTSSASASSSPGRVVLFWLPA
jgi:hypothetical protein